MRKEFLFNVATETVDQYMTRAAKYMDSMANSVPLASGEVLAKSMAADEKEELKNHIMEVVLPEIKKIVSYKKYCFHLDYEKTEDLEVILSMMVFEDLYTFNNPKYIKDSTKKYTISTFIDRKARTAMRQLMIEERGLPVNAIRNLAIITDTINAIVEEEHISENMITVEQVYARLGYMSISMDMVATLMEIHRGIPSLDALDDVDNRLEDNTKDLIDYLETERDGATTEAFDKVIGKFSKLELFILMKEFGYFGEDLRKKTAKELSYQGFFVEMAEFDKDGHKNIEFGDVCIKRPGQNSGIKEEIYVSSVRYVKEKFYTNKFAKVKRELVKLDLPMSEIKAELRGYCQELWEKLA